MSDSSAAAIKQAGREISNQDLAHIREVVGWLPGLNRTELAATICEHLGWQSASGTPKITACLNLLEKLEQQGEIRLPEKKGRSARKRPRRAPTLTHRTKSEQPLNATLRQLAPITLSVVTETEEKRIWSEYMERFHPLGHKEAFGHRLPYFIRNSDRVLGCLYMGGCAKSMGVRDRWIGWSNAQQQRNLPWIINNTRFLILPDIKVPHLASHVLGQLAKRVAADWEEHFGFTPLLMETFVDPRHYAGTCYRAAGWELLGETTGEGLARPGRVYRTASKLLFVKPLNPDFRSLLCSTTLRGRSLD